MIDIVLNTPIKLSSGDEVSMFEAFAGGKILGYVGVYNGELIIVSPWLSLPRMGRLADYGPCAFCFSASSL